MERKRGLGMGSLIAMETNLLWCILMEHRFGGRMDSDIALATSQP
jgi:hypothetical protein